MRFKFLWILVVGLLLACENGDTGLSDSVGQGGSLTRFAIQNNYLYVADNSAIQVFAIAGNEFEKLSDTKVSFGLETIFAKGEYLYLGASDAMYIYSIKQPATPEFIFRYTHILSCDPVIVQGTTAYVTLRSTEGRCRQGINALEIINIADPYNPVLISTYQMKAPGGLGIDGSCLFVCEGDHGFSMLDVSNPTAISVLKEVTNIQAYDVIARQGMLTVTGEDGIFQYNYDCLKKDIQLLSKIPVQREEL